jgi:hypothetical protein
MGRNPWATPEQTAFLESFLDQLEKEKSGNSLKPFYEGIALDFLKRWKSPPPPKLDPSIDDPEKIQVLADEYRKNVRSYKFLLPLFRAYLAMPANLHLV